MGLSEYDFNTLAKNMVDALTNGEDFTPPAPAPKRYHSPPMKIAMMLHFATVVEPFSPEKCRTSPAYTKFVKQLLHDELIKRPTPEEREMYPGWAYKATNRGRAYVESLRAVQLPELIEVQETWGTPR